MIVVRFFRALCGVALLMFSAAVLLGPATPAPALPPELAGDGDWLTYAEQLGVLRLGLNIVNLLVPTLALWLFVSRGAAARLRRRLVERGIRNTSVLAAVFTLLISAGLWLLQLPAAYAGFLLRRAYGLSSEPPPAWFLRQTTAAGISTGITIVGALALYGAIRRFPRRWWIVASAGYIIFSIVLTYVSPLVITPLFFEQRRLDNDDLRARITGLAARAGVPVDDVWVIDASRQGSEGNAYFTGVAGSTRIVLYDTLLQNFPRDDLLAILAHEMGHWRERHIWKGLAVSWIAAAAGLWATQRLLRAQMPRWGIRGADDVASLPYLLLLLSLATFALLPVQNWLSRRWEADADRIAIETTGDGNTYARMMARLARQNLSDPTPPRLVEALFATHPAIGRRVAFAMNHVSALDAPRVSVYHPKRSGPTPRGSVAFWRETVHTERQRP